MKTYNDKYYFSNGIINLKNKDFIAKDPKINVHKSIFDNSENDPRLYGSSSIKEGKITTINNGFLQVVKLKMGNAHLGKLLQKNKT